MKKRKQHYVPQFYLKPWETNGQIFCMRSGSSIFKTSTVNIGQQRDFYRLKELTNQDVVNIKLIIDRMPHSEQAMHQEWINYFTAIFDFKNFLGSRDATSVGVDVEIDIAINNMEEDLHSIIEGMGAPYIKKLLDLDTSFCNDIKEKGDFCYFLSVQYVRTNRMRKRMIDNLSMFSKTVPQEYSGFVPNMERCGGVISHIVATKVGYALSQMPLMLLHNNSDVPFITSDQPAINLKAAYDVTKQTEALELYYPLSPQTAIIITDDAPSFSGNLNEESVIRLNAAVANSSLEQIYASEEHVLKQYL